MSEEQQTEDREAEGQQSKDPQDAAKEKIEELEENPPEKLEDWPKDEAMYETYGGPEGDHSYDEGPEAKLGPSSLRHHEGGEVSIEGEKVDNPDEYKGEPIPGGPTDEDAPKTMGEETKEEKESGSEAD